MGIRVVQIMCPYNLHNTFNLLIDFWVSKINNSIPDLYFPFRVMGDTIFPILSIAHVFQLLTDFPRFLSPNSSIRLVSFYSWYISCFRRDSPLLPRFFYELSFLSLFSSVPLHWIFSQSLALIESLYSAPASRQLSLASHTPKLPLLRPKPLNLLLSSHCWEWAIISYYVWF